MSLTSEQLDILLANGADAATIVALVKCDIEEREKSIEQERERERLRKQKWRMSRNVPSRPGDSTGQHGTRDARAHTRAPTRASAKLESNNLDSTNMKDCKGLEYNKHLREGYGEPIPNSSSDSLFKLEPEQAEPPRTTFVRFYEAYPKHTHRKAACAKFETAINAGIDPEHMIAAALRYAKACRAALIEKQYIPAPDRWLNAGSYDDEDLPLVTRMNGHHDPPMAGRSDGTMGFVKLVMDDIENERTERERESQGGANKALAVRSAR